jgi:hypothetical protein
MIRVEIQVGRLLVILPLPVDARTALQEFQEVSPANDLKIRPRNMCQRAWPLPRAKYPTATSHLDDGEPHFLRFFYPLRLGVDASHKTLTGGLGRGRHSLLLRIETTPA